MTRARTNPEVDPYFKTAREWQEEMKALREVLLDCELTEELKWGKPCYTLSGANLVLIIGFKEYCALLFCKGALLKDPQGLLIQPGENSQAARQIRFTTIDQIKRNQAFLKAYVSEAISAEKAGREVVYKKTEDFKLPAEFETKLTQDPALKAAFRALTPGRQRAYILYFSGAKQSKTRETRITKCIPAILQGKGRDD